MHPPEKSPAKSCFKSQALLFSVLLLLGSCTILQHQAQNHSLGTLERAFPVFLDALYKSDAREQRRLVFSPQLFKTLDKKQAYRGLPSAAVQAPSLSHIYTTRLNRSSKHPPGAISYYKTPDTRLKVRWQVSTQWFTPVGLYAHFWRVDELCWEKPQWNTPPCTFDLERYYSP